MNETLRKYAEVAKTLSKPELLEKLSPEDKARLVEWVDNLKYEWSLHARPQQMPPPGTWNTWLILAGRGWGKVEWGRKQPASMCKNSATLPLA